MFCFAFCFSERNVGEEAKGLAAGSVRQGSHRAPTCHGVGAPRGQPSCVFTVVVRPYHMHYFQAERMEAEKLQRAQQEEEMMARWGDDMG